MHETILPAELPDALEMVDESCRILSLDCFDTLLWRDCHAPADIFTALGRLSQGQRIVAETNARKARRTRHSTSEVRLPEIYEHALPNGSIADIAEAIEDELTVEAASCFAFAPTVELMRAAKARGLTIIIVSDTYFDAGQLEELITRVAGPEIAGLIDKIFVSSEAGMSKSEGLLGKAVRSMKCRPTEVLHIGDNRAADFDGARALGIPALHLVQFSDAARQRLRFERACQQLIGEAAGAIGGLQPHRALIALDEPVIADPALTLGHAVLGPVFHGFDQWLRAEAAAIEAERGGTVHWLFMLRDGHLPHLVHQVGGEAKSTARVEISRFVATAASLRDGAAYDRHMALEFGLNPRTLARQMLLEEQEIEKIVGSPECEEQKREASLRLFAELRTGKRRKLTRRRARALSERLVAHVRQSCDPQPGDTLMLVDLGYNGSAQNGIDALLSERFGCHVAGRYLLLREMAATGLDKKGLIDARHFKPQFLEALCGNVAIIEQLATCNVGSVVDYTEDGGPVRTAVGVKGRQSAVREAVQDGCVAFARAALKPPVLRVSDLHSVRAWRAGAASVLSRFMFLPQRHELAVVERFEHDVNIGSERMVPLFDTARAQEAIRRRGLFYMKGSSRMFLPAELAGETLDTRLSLLAQKCVGLGFTYDDYAPASLEIGAIHFDATDAARSTAQARPTHDGFLAARVPLPHSGCGIAFTLGASCDLVEVASVTRSSVRTLKGEAFQDESVMPVTVHVDNMREIAPRVFQCDAPEATLIVPPGAGAGTGGSEMIEIVLRPIRLKGSEVTTLAAPTPSLREISA